jgi:hypothetical protein
MTFSIFSRHSHLSLCASILLTAILTLGIQAAAQTTSSARTPSDTVREFYKALHEKRFREAFALSIFKPAFEGLSQPELNELKGDFEKMAANTPEKIQVSGEQISGEVATVFVKIADGDSSAEAEPVTLIKRDGVWIVGDTENAEIVQKSGKEFFFNARIQAHQSDAQGVMQRIGIAQLAYAQQHNGMFGTLAALIQAGLVPKDIETPDSTGYVFHVDLANGGKAYSAGAEPAQYGRSGKLSFYMDSGGIKSSDNGGRRLLAQ